MLVARSFPRIEADEPFPCFLFFCLLLSFLFHAIGLVPVVNRSAGRPAGRHVEHSGIAEARDRSETKRRASVLRDTCEFRSQERSRVPWLRARSAVAWTKNSSSGMLRSRRVSPLSRAHARATSSNSGPVCNFSRASSAEHNLFPMPDETHCRRDDAGARSLALFVDEGG
jgi:hypothetical protein